MPDITTGLVLYYPFDSSLTADASGNGNTGTPSNSPTLASGKINNALSVSGNQVIDAGTGSSLDLHSANAFTLAAWVYPTSQPYGCGFISKDYNIYGNGTVQYELGFSMDAGPGSASVPGVGFYDSGSWRLCYRTSGANVPLNAWIHMAGTWDGTSLKLYINGSLDNTTTPGSALPSISGNHTFIGRRHDTGGSVNFLTGLIDDARIYNRALVAADVSMLFTFGNRRKGILS